MDSHAAYYQLLCPGIWVTRVVIIIIVSLRAIIMFFLTVTRELPLLIIGLTNHGQHCPRHHESHSHAQTTWCSLVSHTHAECTFLFLVLFEVLFLPALSSCTLLPNLFLCSECPSLFPCYPFSHSQTRECKQCIINELCHSSLLNAISSRGL